MPSFWKNFSTLDTFNVCYIYTIVTYIANFIATGIYPSNNVLHKRDVVALRDIHWSIGGGKKNSQVCMPIISPHTLLYLSLSGLESQSITWLFMEKKIFWLLPLHLLALKDHRPQNPWLSDSQLFQLPVNNICSILSSTVWIFFGDQQLDEI